jgi:hypothetical protein
MILDIFAGLNQLDTETLSTKIRPHRLSQMSEDVISQLGQPPLFPSSQYLLNIYSGLAFTFAEAQVAPSTVVADKETGEGQPHRLPPLQYPLLPRIDLGPGSQFRSDIPDLSNQQTPPTTSCYVETNGDLSNRSEKSPTGFGVQRQECGQGRAAVTTMKVLAPETIASESSDPLLGKSTAPSAPSAPSAPITSNLSLTAQNSLPPSHSSPAVSEAPMPRPFPDSRQLDRDSVERAPSIDLPLALSTTAQDTSTSPPSHPSRYIQAFSLMTSLFGTTLSPAKVITVIRTGDRLVRDDAVSFLKDQLPLWRGMWYKSNLLMPSSDDSVTDHFVKVSRCIAFLKERSVMDRIRVLLHRVLQYQFYLGFLEEVRHEAKDQEVKRKRGIRDASYALDHLLENLYVDDWDLIGPAEKQRRRNLLHKQKRLGKRLTTLSRCMGFGILLLGSQEAMGRM